MSVQQSRGGVGRWVLALVVVGALVVAGWWAGRATVISGLEDPDAGGVSEPVWGVAQETSVGRTVPVSVTVRQPMNLIGVNHLAGVVTSVDPGPREQGDVLYRVGNTPVRVIEADVLFWRDLRLGSQGADVEALQRALKDLGHLNASVDGRFGPATRAAVIAWEKALGAPSTGEVLLGQVVTVPGLPAQITLDDAVAPSRVLTGGEDAVFATTGEYQFVLILGDAQARLIPVDARVDVTYGEHRWQGVVVAVEEDPAQNAVMTLGAPDGGPVCGQECDVLPQGEEISVLAHVVVVPAVTGVGVPTAAVVSDAQGQAWVVTREGRLAVTVVGAGQGVTIVEGLEAGVEVQLSDGAPAQRGVPGPDPGEDPGPVEEPDPGETSGWGSGLGEPAA